MMIVCFLLTTRTGEAKGVMSSDTVVLDTTRLLSDQPLKSPMGALLRSAILPGWGQWYNQQYAKSIFTFALNAVLIQRIFYYHRQWRHTGRAEFRNKRNTFTWYEGIAYILTLVDAYVDAYLFGFNQAMQISVSPIPRDWGERVSPWVSIKVRWSFSL